jgi:membrane protein YdbS with pleckstrin-like domain
MRKYKSKVGLELVIPIAIILMTTLALMIYQKLWPGVVLIALVAAFIIHMFSTTYYVVADNNLTIKCGFLFNQTIPIQIITKISETRNPLSSPAVSIDRLEIKYNKYSTVLVSPAEKTDFIQTLLAINPAIQVRLKSK